jgi:hypothetical protein
VATDIVDIEPAILIPHRIYLDFGQYFKTVVDSKIYSLAVSTGGFYFSRVDVNGDDIAIRACSNEPQATDAQ